MAQGSSMAQGAGAAGSAKGAAPPTSNLLRTEQSKSDSIQQAVGSMEDLTEEKRARLTLQLALADFLTVHGNPPDSLEDLVPLYFPAIPINPKTGKPFRYVRQGKMFLLRDE